MGFAEILTIIFIVLKLCGVIGWSWFFVILPEIIMIFLYALILLYAAKSSKEIKKRHERYSGRWDD